MSNNMIKLTDLWKKQTSDGEIYLSGLISPTSQLIIFPNTRKVSPKEPDYTAFIAPYIKKAGRGKNWF